VAVKPSDQEEEDDGSTVSMLGKLLGPARIMLGGQAEDQGRTEYESSRKKDGGGSQTNCF